MLGSGARRRHATRARRWPLEGPSRPLNSTPRERPTGSWPVLVGDDHLPYLELPLRPTGSMMARARSHVSYSYDTRQPSGRCISLISLRARTAGRCGLRACSPPARCEGCARPPGSEGCRLSVFAQRVAYRGAVVEFLEPSSLQVGVQGVHYSVARNENPDCGYKRDYSIQIAPSRGPGVLNPQHPAPQNRRLSLSRLSDRELQKAAGQRPGAIRALPAAATSRASAQVPLSYRTCSSSILPVDN
jgi:hypothetical protein